MTIQSSFHSSGSSLIVSRVGRCETMPKRRTAGSIKVFCPSTEYNTDDLNLFTNGLASTFGSAGTRSSSQIDMEAHNHRKTRVHEIAHDTYGRMKSFCFTLFAGQCPPVHPCIGGIQVHRYARRCIDVISNTICFPYGPFETFPYLSWVLYTSLYHQS